MALTDIGHRLSVDHRRNQQSIRREFLRGFSQLWPVWNVTDPGSFGRLVDAALPLTEQLHGASSAATSRYLNAYRQVEGVQGETPDLTPARFNREAVQSSAYVTGQNQARRSLDAGFPTEQVRRTTLTTLTGAMARHVADGGRQTLMGAVREDGQAFGWERMTGPDPCPFCAMLASRGSVYKSRESAELVGFGSDNVRRGFPAQYGRIRGTRQRGDSFHDNCNCYAEARYLGDPLISEENRPYRELWNETTQDSSDPIKDFRRAYEGRDTSDAPESVKRALGGTPTRDDVERSVESIRTITEADVPRLVDRQVEWAQSVGWDVEQAGRTITGVRNENRTGIGGIQWQLTDRGTWKVVRADRQRR